MKFEWDKNKEKTNLVKHGINFDFTKILFKSKLIVHEDKRKSYGEKRYSAYGVVLDRCMNIVFTMRHGTIRVISLRKANKRETRRYYQAIKSY